MNTVVGVLGMSDTPHFGDTISPRIVVRELSDRVPHVEFRMLAPFGWQHPVAAGGGAVIEPLGLPTAGRRAELADQLDAMIIGGGEIIHDRDHVFAARYAHLDNSGLAASGEVAARSMGRWFIEGVGRENEARCPTVWNGVGVPYPITGDTQTALRESLAQRAYVSVRDDRSLARLRSAGAQGDIAVVPDLGFLVPRLMSPELLRRRRALHHLMNWLPTGDYVLVQGNESLLPLVGQMCAALEAALGGSELAVVVLETTRSGGPPLYAEAMRRRCPIPVHALPGDLANEDIAAVIAGATAVIAVSVHTSVTSMAFGVSTVIVNVRDQSKLTALVELTGPTCEEVIDISDLPAALRKALGTTSDGQLVSALQVELDAHFDRIAGVIEQAGATAALGGARSQRRVAVVAQEVRALRRAHAVRSRQLVAERSALAAAVEAQSATTVAVQVRLDALHEETVQLTHQLVDVHHHHGLAVQRITELDSLLQQAHGEREAIATRSGQQVAHLQSQLDALGHHTGELREQLQLTETALADVHRTKTFRLARLPRRIFGWLQR